MSTPRADADAVSSCTVRARAAKVFSKRKGSPDEQKENS